MSEALLVREKRVLSVGVNVLPVGCSEVKIFSFRIQLMLPVNKERMARVPVLICDKAIREGVAQ